ncbi:UNVERIFIED_CONTAM: hypothetical protein K2H54_045610 [Gekko kuhli]
MTDIWSCHPQFFIHYKDEFYTQTKPKLYKLYLHAANRKLACPRESWQFCQQCSTLSKLLCSHVSVPTTAHIWHILGTYRPSSYRTAKPASAFLELCALIQV